MGGQILVPFDGDGAGVAGLSWGQRNVWLPIRRQRSSLPIAVIRQLTPGVTAGDVAAQLRLLVSRHPALRTRVEYDPAADRRARQVLSSSGELPVEIVDGGTAGHDPAQVAQAVRDRYLESEFSYPDEWPLRCAIVTHRGAPSHLVQVFSHLALDTLGLVAMQVDLLRRGEDRIGLAAPVAARGITTSAGPGEPGAPPLEQAHWQASPAGQRVSSRALRRWERLMNGVPAQRVDGAADPREPRFWVAVSQSAAACLAVRAIAGRLARRTAPVLLAAYAVAFARVMGSNPVLVRVLVSNRLRPGLAGTVSPVVQPGLAVIDVAEASFGQLVHDTWRATVAAARHSYYDPYELEDLAAAMASRRGEETDVRCSFNDRRIPAGPEAAGPPPAPDQLTGALAQTTLRWKELALVFTEPFFVSAQDVPGAPDVLAWSVSFDTEYISHSRVEAFLREMEAILVSAALDPACAVPNLAHAR